jgi:putative ABC transport system substrate-binding protein
MDRRRFLLTSVAGVLTARVSAEAQQPGNRAPLIGVLLPGARTSPQLVRAAQILNQGFQELGYIPGQSITVEYRYGQVDEMQGLANELVSLHVDVMVVAGTHAALAAKRATNTIPIVVPVMADPVADGLVASLGRPGGNITGITFLAPELGPKRLELLRELLPGVSRVSVLQHPRVYSERTIRDMLQTTEASAKALGVDLHVLDTKSVAEFDNAFSAAAAAWGRSNRLSEPHVLHRISAHRRCSREVPGADGLLLPRGSDGRRPHVLRCRHSRSLPPAATFVDKIFKGAKPATLPVEQPTKFETWINLKTAKTLRLTFPPSLLARADQIVE